MTIVIAFYFLGLEGQNPSSLEDDGIGHGHLHNSFTEERMKVAIVILLFFLGIGRADLLFFRRYALTTSTALH